jgi:type III secretion system FlhB-like substrate exporter
MNDERRQRSGSETVRRVVGLGYDPEHGVPRVLLKAAGRSAEDIIWRGQRGAGTPLVKDPAALEALFRLPVDADIPPDLFELVAIILVHVSAVDAEVREAAPAPPGVSL